MIGPALNLYFIVFLRFFKTVLLRMTLRTQRTNGGLDHRNLRIIRVFIMNLWGPNLSSLISLQFSCFVAEMFITLFQ